MSLEVIRFQVGDTITTILDAMRRTDKSHLLLITPYYGPALLEEYADAAQVRQLSRSLSLRVGVVTIRPVERAVVRAAGLPVYATEGLGRWQIHRPWWYPIQPRFPGKRTKIDFSEMKAMHFRIVPRPRWQKYLLFYITSIATVATLAFLAYTAWFVVPNATVTLRPEIKPIRIVEPLIVDPRYDENVPEPGSVPGKLLVAGVKWSASVEATDNKRVPTAPARGKVTFVNKLPSPLVIPAGTRVTTSGGNRIVYQTLKDANAPATIGGQVDVDVVAIELGEEGNVAANQINRVDGPLTNQVNVRNLFAMSNGNSRYAKATNEKDRERLRQHVLNGIRDQAKIDMSDQISDGEFVVDDSIRIIVIYEELYSHFIGEETDELTLEIRAEVHGTAVDEQLALETIDERLEAEAPEQYSIMKETVRPQLGELLGVDATGRVTLELIGDAIAQADLSLRLPIETIAGQETGYALAYLNDNLPLRDMPSIEIWPSRIKRLPYVAARINVEIDIDQSDD